MPLPHGTLPQSFAYDEASRSLVIEWNTGMHHAIPFLVLRLACPCATCHGEMGVPGRFASNPQLLDGEDELADISLVGSYGLTVRWADGHNTGIYTYERLYDLGTSSDQLHTQNEGPTQ